MEITSPSYQSHQEAKSAASGHGVNLFQNKLKELSPITKPREKSPQTTKFESLSAQSQKRQSPSQSEANQHNLGSQPNSDIKKRTINLDTSDNSHQGARNQRDSSQVMNNDVILRSLDNSKDEYQGDQDTSYDR